AAELAQPPQPESLLRIIALPLGEDHVVWILLVASIAVVVFPEQPRKNNFLRTVDVGGPRYYFRYLRAVLELVDEHARFVQRLQNRFYRFGIAAGELLGERA